MLRKMLGSGRRPAANTDGDSSEDIGEDSDVDEIGANMEAELEPWTEWVQRTTHSAEEAARLTGVRDWVVEQSRRKWIWAGHVARRTDQRWTKVVMDWIPSCGSRRAGHPDTRWADGIDSFFRRTLGMETGIWKEFAQDRANWNSLAVDFANFVIE